jgi:hypothetical protein
MEKWRYSYIFLDLGNRRRWVVSFTPLPLYPYRYPLDRRLCEPQRRSETYKEKASTPAGNRTWAIRPPVHLITDELCRIPQKSGTLLNMNLRK